MKRASISLGILILILVFIIPVSAEYLKVPIQPTPTNDAFERYVYQGDQLYENRAYDLSGVAYPNRSFAWWSNWKEEDLTCNPDVIVDLNWITNNQTYLLKNIFLTNPPWRLGNWYRWDGCHVLYDHSGRVIGYGLDPNENRFAFSIISLPGKAINTEYTPAETPSLPMEIITVTMVPLLETTPIQEKPFYEMIPLWLGIIAIILILVGLYIFVW